MNDAKIDAIISASSNNNAVEEVLSSVDLSEFSSHADFCLQFSTRVAKKYVARELNFESSDRAMNWLFNYSYALDGSPGEMPDLAREIFEAFDSGEYYHAGDSRDEDPEEKYTRPTIEAIVSKLRST